MPPLRPLAEGTLIMFLKVLRYLILKIKSFVKYLKKGLEIFQNFHEIFKHFIQSEIFHRASLCVQERRTCMTVRWRLPFRPICWRMEYYLA